MNTLIGQQLGPYQILEEIGRGGMAVVYKAWDTVNNRHVALKVLPPYFQHDTEFLRRFLEEARRTILLRHPYIVETYDTGQTDGYYYIAMEYMGGGNLAARLRTQRRLSLEDATTVVSQIATALDYAHDQGLIHRDVKPSNILFDQSDQAKLADFGIAKAADQATVTMPGTLVGTPEYMSPEQGQGRQVDERTDIWSLGVVLYQTLTGRLPFGGDNPHATLYQVVHQRHLPVSSLNRDLPRGVDGVLDKVLEKLPRRRYRRAGDMASALRHVVHRPTEEPTVLKGKTEPATTRLEGGAVSRRSPLPSVPWAIFGGMGALLLVAALVFGIPRFVRWLETLGPPTPTPTKTVVVGTATQTPVTLMPTATPTPMPTTPTSTPTTPPPTPTLTPTPPMIIHTVVAGDTLSSIARKYGTTVEAIMAANGKTDTLLSVDEELIIPIGPVTPATPTWTPTPVPPTATPSPPPTNTPTPTPRYRTPTPTPAPTLTPTPVPKATPTATRTATHTPTPVPAFAPLEPPDGATRSGLITFEWAWSGQLGPGETFDLKVCKGEDCPLASITNTTDTSAPWPWCPDAGEGIYRWKVEVIDDATKERKGPASAEWYFEWQGGCGGPPPGPSPTSTPR